MNGFKDWVEEKLFQFKKQVKWKMDDVKVWIKNNPEATGFLSIVACKVLWNVNRSANRRRLERDRKEKLLDIYDRRLGMHLKLKRQLTSRELAEYNYRLSTGETAYAILSDMNVLR